MRVVEGSSTRDPGEGSAKERDGISMSFPSVPVGCTRGGQSLSRYAISSHASVPGLVLPITMNAG
jgi:hypothetical protein